MLTVQKMMLATREPILQDFSFDFSLHNFYQIEAENGTGKTSFLRALTGLIRLTNGKVLYDGHPFFQKREDVFYFEDGSWLNPNLTSADYLSFVKRQWGSSVDLNAERQFLGVEEFQNVPIKKYSLGMKQKLIIAMYFVSGAKYLLMDEITNGLDEHSRMVLYQRLSTEISEHNKCILLTSHYGSELHVSHTHRLIFRDLQIMEG
ncbi:ABC transporter ATP-binding protein [Schleiferilactobacillus shenzhenensis]|uniref:ABC transporter domain-containing protein n=1 Tax=Schleiferilactobacillus shenzhenensis LY-73 TaxID=1231336 RepID=U4TSG6_9LACO|nr:ABC transporter ATP-binding protein [Schleiferilactobacillus shenzhenensis]ERL64427.1 hypothetical protein L248_0969 [Schleiferilactobacillus shenzhenensis LY-73]